MDLKEEIKRDRIKEKLSEKPIKVSRIKTIGKLKVAKSFVEMVIKGYSNSCILMSKGGLGKSFLVVEALKENKLKEDEFAVLTTYSTPLAFYGFLYENKDKLIFLDDIEGILSDKKGLSMLKSALWSIGLERKVCYQSTTELLHERNLPEEFIFTGRIIFACNKLRVKNKDVQAFKSRCLFYEINLSQKETLKMMKEIVKKPYKKLTLKERKSCLSFIKKNVDVTMSNLNFRTLIHIFDVKSYSDKWKPLAYVVMEKTISDIAKLIYSLAGDKPIKKSQLVRALMHEKNWCKKTCYNRIKDWIELEELHTNDLDTYGSVALKPFKSV